MATRSIVTSQPYAACDVCGRRLLRGENPHGFLASGEPRMVCELCVPRATQEGWLRASEAHAGRAAPPQSRGPRTLLSRLRGLREARPQGDSRTLGRGERASRAEPAPAPMPWLEPQQPGIGHATEGAAPEDAAGEGAAEDGAPPPEPAAGPGGLGATPVPARPAHGNPDAATHALELFNASEYPRRIAGIARALGEPSVVVRPAPGLPGQVSIVVAWELCWYRYLVDPDAESGATTTAAQGMEVGELEQADRLANAVAGEDGELALA